MLSHGPTQSQCATVVASRRPGGRHAYPARKSTLGCTTTSPRRLRSIRVLRGVEGRGTLTAQRQPSGQETPPTQRCITNDAGIEVAVPGYTPVLLGNDTASAGMVVGGRMEEISAVSRQLTVMPGGYVDLHLRDQAWWNDSAVPSSETRDVMGRMAQLSTRLVADAWYTAWTLSQRPAVSSSVSSVRMARNTKSDPEYEKRWEAMVSKAAAFDRLEALPR